MPGIHVRSLGKLDWVERGNEPILTVPGAYWLCHKKQIYKFTFKWHKTLRNTQGFAYPKELTKVIRRIIKSQPRQGQQFGTRHLLVTYNHSAWMRQDKMFAMLKFQDRSDATAFPHAFVLTVKTIDGAAPSEADPSHPDEGPTLTVLEDAKNGRLQAAPTPKHEENSRHSQDNQSTNRSSSSRSKDQIEIFARVSHPEKSGATSSSSSKEGENNQNNRKNDPGKKPTKRPRTSEKSEASPLSKKKYQQDRINLRNKETPKDLPAEKEITADCADLPYQYIIEKEIENSKSASVATSPGPSHKDHNSSIRSLPRSPKIAIADTARSANITDLVMEGLMFTIRQDQDTVTVVEQKTKLEVDEVLENSEKAETKEGEKCLVNSSLLRLENLITKIEMPEARLKNNDEEPKSAFSGSGKIVDKSFTYDCPPTNLELSAPATKFDATTLGNDCLWKYQQTPLALQPNFASQTPTFPLVKINVDNVKNVLSDTLSFDEGAKEAPIAASENGVIEQNRDKTEEKEATDIFNEGEEEEDEVGLELKYEDKDEEDSEREDEILSKNIEPESSEKNENDALLVDDLELKKSSKHDPSSTPIKDCLETMKSKTPRVVSNEIVTDDQIPPELQRALRYKRTRRLFPGETTEINDGKDEDEITEEGITTEDESPTSLSVENEAPEENTPEVPTIDITEEFQRELSSGKARRQPTRRKSSRHVEQSSSEADQSTEEPEIHIEMWKFIQDITRGAKVVVHRLDLANIPNCIVTDSSLEKYNSSRRYATES